MQYAWALLCLGAVSGLSTLVRTRNGFVRGTVSEGYFSFSGIPYGKVNPKNPFGDSMDVPPFAGVYDAVNDNVVCPQLEMQNNTVVGNLDCLRLHIYVPEDAPPDKLLPVMVFIYGGNFTAGNPNRGEFGPNLLISKNVILVTLSYRLGPYGFMNINRADIPGNTGLRDQLKAMEWVKDNIAAFGGDEDNITLAGQSAGSASVEFHILGLYAKGLFQKAIMQSGTVLCDWVMIEPDYRSPIKLAQYLGVETDNIDVALQFLSTAHPHDVIKASVGIGYLNYFKASVESKFPNVKPMVRDKPTYLLKEADITIPVIIGFNSRETYNQLKSPSDFFKIANSSNIRSTISYYFVLNEKELDEAEKLIRSFYFGDKKLDPITYAEKLLDFDTDFTFIYPSLRASRYYTRSGVPVYLYTFDYAGQRNYAKNTVDLQWIPGAMHADEIGYLATQSVYRTVPVSFNDAVTTHRLTTTWTNFVKTSNPNSEELGSFIWQRAPLEPLSSESYAYIGNNIEMTQHIFLQRMIFWEHFFSIYGNKQRW